MKAEEVFIKCGNEYNNVLVKSADIEQILNEPELVFIFKAMKDYARIQIEKDREEIIDKVPLTKKSEHTIRHLPINLD